MDNFDQDLQTIAHLLSDGATINEGHAKLAEIISRENAFEYINYFFQAPNPYLQSAGAKILEKQVKKNWNPENTEFIQHVSILTSAALNQVNLSVRPILAKVYIMIMYRTNPVEFLTGMLPELQGQLDLFSEFLSQFNPSDSINISNASKASYTSNTSNASNKNIDTKTNSSNPMSWKIPVAQSEEIRKIFRDNCILILQILLNERQVPAGLECLKRFIPYCHWEDISKVIRASATNESFIQAFFSLIPTLEVLETQELSVNDFIPLCCILLIDDIPTTYDNQSLSNNILKVAFTKLFKLLQIAKPNSNIISHFLKVLQRYIFYFEAQPGQEMILSFHQYIARNYTFGDESVLDYWHDFIMSVFEDYSLHGNTTRYTIHQGILKQLREHLIQFAPRPPEFLIPGVIDNLDISQQQLVEYAYKREMVVAFLTLNPTEVYSQIMEMIKIVQDQPFNQETFLPIIYALACISGTTTSKLEDILVVSSLQFILKVYSQIGNVNHDENYLRARAIIASSFLFLAASYSRAQKLTSVFAKVVMRLTMESLAGKMTSVIALRTLLFLSKFSPKLIEDLPQVEILLRCPFVDPKMFGDLVEAFARFYYNKSKIGDVADIINTRIQPLLSVELSPDSVKEMELCIIGFTSISRISNNLGKAILKNLSPMFSEMIKKVTTQAMTNFSQTDEDITEREDMLVILGFIRAITSFYSEMSFLECGDLFQFYLNSPNSFKGQYIEALKYGESILKTKINLSLELITGIHDTLIVPTENLVLEDTPSSYLQYLQNTPGDLLYVDENISHYDHFNVLAKILLIISRSYFKIMNEEDFNYLIVSLRSNNQPGVLTTIQALDSALTRGDLELTEETRQRFLTSFVPPALFVMLIQIANPSHQFCYNELLDVLYKWFQNSAMNRVLPPLPDQEQPLIPYLAESIVAVYSVITMEEMMNLIALMLKKREKESFQDLMVQYVSRAQQTTREETLNHLKVQKLLESVQDSFL